MTDAAFRLDANWDPPSGGPGRLTLTLVNLGEAPVSDFRLAFTALLRIRPEAVMTGGSIVEQVSNYHVIAPPDGFVIGPGEEWRVTAEGVSHDLRHYTYGPKSAFLLLSGEATRPVRVTAMTRGGAPLSQRPPRPRPGPLPAAAPPVSLIPFPAAIDVSGARPLPACLGLSKGAPAPARAAFAAVSALGRRLFPGEPPLLGEGGLPIEAVTDPALPAEAFRLAFAAGGITLAAAASGSGFLNGFNGLAQMLRGARARPGTFVLPLAGIIDDRPRFAWRGAHLDVARQVYSGAEILAFLDRMAWLRLNRFHVHLSDDEGWRIDVPALPELSRIAAWRGHGLPIPPLLGSGISPYGGVLARDDIGQVIERAEELGIEVIPEIDIPGHCHAVLQALPRLRDPGETGAYRSIQAFPNNALNPALPETWAFLETVFGTVADLFPGRFIHVGGDEVAEDAWRGSPQARALMAANGWTTAFELQSHFLKRVQGMIAGLGRGTGAWEEAALGGGIEPAGSYLVAWRRAASGPALATAGYDVVLAPAEHCYFDMAQSDDFAEPGAAWAGTVSVADTYAFDPGGDWPEEIRPRLLGVQSCLWSENLDDRTLFDRLLFPRLPALAEVAWTPAGARDLARFSAIAPLMPGGDV